MESWPKQLLVATHASFTGSLQTISPLIFYLDCRNSLYWKYVGQQSLASKQRCCWSAGEAAKVQPWNFYHFPYSKLELKASIFHCDSAARQQLYSIFWTRNTHLSTSGENAQGLDFFSSLFLYSCWLAQSWEQEDESTGAWKTGKIRPIIIELEKLLH